MRKFISILFLSLVYCEFVNAEFIELNKCYLEKFNSFSEANSKKLGESVNYIDYTITINLNSNSLTETIVKDQKSLDAWNKYLEERYGSNFSSPRISQRIYEILTYSAGLITAKKIENKGTFIDERILYLDLQNKKFDKVWKTIKSGKITHQNNFQFICEDTFTEIAEDTSGSSGTAFFISNKGYLLTNNHVVEGCSLSKISYKNNNYDATLIATDKNLDLALLKTEVEPKSFFSFAKDDAKKLNKVYVAGYPLGKGLSDDLKISSGIVSSLKGFEDNSNEIQIDAPINPGNSGGPIINENGNLVAIAVSGMAKDQTEGINFGIKSSAAETFLKANNINPKKSMYSGVKENDMLLEILEEGTVYTYCE